MRYKKFLQPKGFTLVELLAVITITGVVGTLMFGVLFATLQGAKKSDSLGIIQQNGNFTLNQMSRMIRYASALEDPTSCYTGPTPTPVSQTSLTIRNADNNSTVFLCNLTDGTIASNGASLLDTNAVSVSACSFECIQNSPNDYPTINISFTLNKKNGNNLVENNTSIPFQTSVTLRNVQ